MGSATSHNLPDRPPDEVFQVRVANAGNSCYLDSVLFAMFAVPSPSLDSLLSRRFPNSDMNAANKIELQRVVSKQFVCRIRSMVSVSTEMMVNIRAQCRRCGWEYMGAPDQQQDACEFFSFFYLALGGQPLRLTRRTFTGALPDTSDRGQEENLAILPVPLCDTQSEGTSNVLSLNGMLDTWFYENVATGLRRKLAGCEQEVFALNTYSIENVPTMVAVALKRFDQTLNKVDTEVAFPPEIFLHKYSSRVEWRSSPLMATVPWSLRSIVCHRGASTEAGHYYSYTRFSRRDSPTAVWLRFDDASTPCVTQTNIWADPYVRTEAVLLLYELDSDAHTAALMNLQDEEEQGLLEGALGRPAGSLGMGMGMGLGVGHGARSSGPSSLDIPISFNRALFAPPRLRPAPAEAPAQRAKAPSRGSPTNDNPSATPSPSSPPSPAAPVAPRAASPKTPTSPSAPPPPASPPSASPPPATAPTPTRSASPRQPQPQPQPTEAAVNNGAGVEAMEVAEVGAGKDGRGALLVTSNGGAPVWAVREAAVGTDGVEVWTAALPLPAGRAPLVCLSGIQRMVQVRVEAWVRVGEGAEVAAVAADGVMDLLPDRPSLIFSAMPGAAAAPDGAVVRLRLLVRPAP